MRKYKKEQADSLIKLLEEAHNGIRTTVEKDDLSNALGLLADCQEVAIALGTMIEQSEGEGLPIISLLEQYCELIYQIYESIIQNEEVKANQIYAQLNQLLVKIVNRFENDITVRKEVVFLPYKASMWDALESIWKKADGDPEYDVYVIPIPYFDKDPDGSFREEHYEADQMPDYVPITSYEEYNFAERHPDEIYIHNPYDERNFVTSVHPFFYSKNLKQYTEKLIYIPYFVLGEIDPLNKAAVEGMEHFVTVPAVINADVVIVQSENMKQCYVQSMVKYAGEHTRHIWENKILGLGSPKFDKVKNTTKDDVQIPEDWKRLMIKPDGSYKKVVLYNTSVSVLLEHGDKMLDKIQSVFETFKELTNDVVLLWRPHPLIKATIESMRPNLWMDYEKIVNQYKIEAWGIYDDSAELNRAIVLSDGYYGDPSSLVQLCQKVKMPVMIQNVEILN